MPRTLVREPGWLQFLEEFPGHYPTAEAFAAGCRRAAGGADWFGIRTILHLLVTGAVAEAMPVQAPTEGRAWMIGICPAFTLKAENLCAPCKRRQARHWRERGRILQQVMTRGTMRLERADLRAAIVDDTGGDALDSLVAVWSTCCALRSGLGAPAAGVDDYRSEGLVHV